MIKLLKSKWALFIGLSFMELSFFSAQDVMASSSIFSEIKVADDQIKISGKIVDTAGEPLIGATIVVKGNATKGTITDVNGNFSLVVDSDCVILISSVGYADKEITASKLQGMTIILEEASELVDEVVVVGYGTKKKRDLTGSIGSISAKELKNTPVKDVLSAMQGKVAGVQITTASGAPGDGITVRVRGFSSLNSGNEPLYVVDGVPIETTSTTLLNVSGSRGLSPLSYLSPNDIESIEILKDAASASIYGSRAANGVVLITTKKGMKGKAKVDVNASFGISNITRKLSVLNANQWREAILEGYANYDKIIGRTTDISWSVIDAYNPLNRGDEDWQSLMYRTAYEKQVGLSVLGGNESLRYSVNASYLDQDGVLLGSNYKRITARSNTEYDVTKFLKIGTNVSYVHGVNDRVASEGMGNKSLVVAIITRPPTYSLTYPDGSYFGYMNGKRNPVAMAEEVTNLCTSDRLTGNAFAEISFLKHFKFKSNISVDIETMKEDEFFPTTVDYREGYNTGAVRVSQHTTWTNENFFTYNQTFKEDHNVSGLLGFSQQAWRTTVTGLDGMYFPTDDLITLNGAGQISGQNCNVAYAHAMASFFGKVSYDYKSKYLFEANLRADGSSRFGKNNRFGYFPSASAAWRVSAEPFMKKLSFINDAKIRFSVGQTGNEAIDNYVAQGILLPNNNYLTNSGVAPSKMPNEDLTWETTTQYDLGVDLSFFNSHLDFTFDAYLKRTKDLLYTVPLPNTTGFSSVQRNVGTMENKGLEFTLTSRNDFGDFHWTSSLNISMNRNKVIDLPDEVMTNGYIDSGSFQILKEGEPIGVFYGFNAEGIYSRDEDNVNQVRHNSVNGYVFKGGDVKFTDLDNNNVIDSNDRMIIGNPHPDFTGGFTNEFSYKNFSLNAFLQFSYGNDIYNNVAYYRNDIFSYNNISREAFDNRWKEQGDVTSYPRIVRNDPMGNNSRVQSRWVEDGSYLKLKSVTLSYNFPKRLIEKIHLDNLKLYVTGHNLITWTKYSGYDPDVDSFGGLNIGVDYGAYPQCRSFQFGINIGF